MVLETGSPLGPATAVSIAAGWLLAALFAHWLLRVAERRLPVLLAAERQRAAGLHLRWRRTLEVALLPAKLGVWLGALYLASAWWPPLERARAAITSSALTGLRRPLFTVSDKAFDAIDLLALPLALGGLWLAASACAWLVRTQLLARAHFERGVQESVAALTRYAVLFLGAIVVLQVWGIEASTLAIAGSVLGIGIGFGLQHIASNFISGILLGLERPIQAGDYVELGGFAGTVERVGARSTLIRTQDRVSIVVPNARFLESDLTNWSHGDPVSRLRVPVSVAYGTSASQVRRVLSEVALRHAMVLRDPRPEVQLTALGASALEFELLVYFREPREQQRLRSDLNFALVAAFRRAGLAFPFPQLDLHLRDTPFDTAPERMERENETLEEGEEVGDGRLRSDTELRALIARMRGADGLAVADRRHRLQVYPRCFVGREAVDWLVAHEGLSRGDAVEVGRQMMERGWLHHVLDEHPFDDRALFYRWGGDVGERPARVHSETR